MMRSVSQQDTRCVRLQRCAAQNRLETLRMCERAVGHAYELQAIHNHLLIHQSANAAVLERLYVLVRMRELFVISRHEEFAERRRHIHPGRSQVFWLYLVSVVKITCDEYDVRPKLPHHGHDARDKCVASNVAQVGIRNHCSHPSTPRLWQTRQPDISARNTDP